PYKHAEWLNEIGEKQAKLQGVNYLVSDFKKKDGYRRSIELSKQYQLYRQDYCGCVFSKAERDRRKRNDQPE
ncbi:MAG: epoxyqueuosine reductase QueH, partial [Lachnospiraceae bacterium]|nr:epoxyqueuosine reductase QueH [Lachnospiraceae bacterium]